MGILESVKTLRRLLIWRMRCFPSKREFGAFGDSSTLEYPTIIDNINSVFVEPNVTLRDNLRIINAPNEKVIIKQYSVLSSGVTIITNSHRSTVGVPHFILGPSHINDKSGDVQIDEDVWVGANATILAGVHLGRGCVVSAGAVVTKSVPPYTLVAGTPARILKRVFTKKQVIRHEEGLYPPDKRTDVGELSYLSADSFQGSDVFGVEFPSGNNYLSVLDKIMKDIHYVGWKE